MKLQKPDFSGWATRANLLCSDGLTIRSGAFKKDHQKTVPLVWDHRRDDSDNVVGKAVLSYNNDGVRAKGYFNDTDRAKNLKVALQHGDLDSLSIYANHLLKRGNDVLDGNIGEVSLVISGANPGARIDFVSMNHNSYEEMDDGEAIIYSNFTIEHGDSNEDSKEEDSEVEDENTDDKTTDKKTTDKKTDPTLQDVYDTLNEDQKKLLDYMVAEALDEGVEHSNDEEDDDTDDEDDSVDDKKEKDVAVTHNFFDGEDKTIDEGVTLTHAQVQTIVQSANSSPNGKLSSSVLQHAGEYGITNIEMLFPEAKSAEIYPELVKRRTEWVSEVLGAVKKSPFAAVKSFHADLTFDTARAKGYIKGSMKKDEFFALSTRKTTPTTIYKKQKLDRDDILDITDFDVVMWLKAEIRIMLDEELARAILIGDGRTLGDTDKIKDPMSLSDGAGIRSIYNDNDFYAYHYEIPNTATEDEIPDHIVLAMLEYHGKGNPTFYVSRQELAKLTLLKDGEKRRLFPTRENLTDALGVAKITDVDVFTAIENLVGIVANLDDYTLGTNKGGETTFFSDFDIDFNQEKYLLETRLSGGLTHYRSAIVLTRESVTP